MSQAADLSYGISREVSLHNQIEELVGDSIERRGGMSVFDYSNKAKTIYVELKSRRINHDQYPTALIGLNKVEFCSNPEVDYYFAYSYLDGIYYIKYDKDLFATFEVNTSYQRGDRADCHNRPSAIVYVPVKHLTKYEPGGKGVGEPNFC
jgi:hypothetical protein